MQKNTTMRDLARKLGCSPMTISKALRGSPDIPQGTREKVQSASLEMGYIPNRWASAAKSSKFNSAGYVFHCPPLPFSCIPNTSFSMEFISGVSEELALESLTLSIDFSESKIVAGKLPRLLSDRSSDGVIIEFEVDNSIREHLRRANVPAVFLNSNVQEEHDCVYADEIHIGYESAMHLIRLGHSRILFPIGLGAGSSLSDAHFSLKQRLAGYERAMRRAGLEPMTAFFRANDGNAFANDVVDFFKSGSMPFTALVSGGATPVYVEALRRGIKVPEELSIVALDMSFSQTRVFFNLDRALMDRYAMGRAAGRMLLAKIREPEKLQPSHVERPALLSLGSSSNLRAQ